MPALKQLTSQPLKSLAVTQPVPIDNSRIDWIDYVKGIGIFLVVLGHTLRGLVNSAILEPSVQVQMMDQWIYAFHMPLFFFLSGLFIECSVSKKTLRAFSVRKIQAIVYPYFVWSIFQEVVRQLTVSVSNSGAATESLWRIFYAPVMQFWFLYVLFILAVGYAVLRKASLPVNTAAVICFSLYALHLLGVNLGPWGVAYLFQINAIYFAMGLLATKVNALDRLGQLFSAHWIGGAVVGYLLIALSVFFNLSAVQAVVPLLAFVGIVSSLSLAIFLQRGRLATFLNQWGLLSLEIFVAHTIFSAGIRIFLQKILHLSNPAVHIVAGTLIGIYGPIGLYIICKKLNLLYLFRLRPSYATKN